MPRGGCSAFWKLPTRWLNFRAYEIRRLLIGDYILLYTIVEETRTVWVIGFRHGSRLPRPDNLSDPTH